MSNSNFFVSRDLTPQQTLYWRFAHELGARMVLALFAMAGGITTSDSRDVIDYGLLGEYLWAHRLHGVRDDLLYPGLRVSVSGGLGSETSPYLVNLAIDANSLGTKADKVLAGSNWGYAGEPPSPLAWFTRSCQHHVAIVDDELQLNTTQLFHPEVGQPFHNEALFELELRLDSLYSDWAGGEPWRDYTVEEARQLTRLVLINAKGGNLINLAHFKDAPYKFRTTTGGPELSVYLVLGALVGSGKVEELQLYGPGLV